MYIYTYIIYTMIYHNMIQSSPRRSQARAFLTPAISCFDYGPHRETPAPVIIFNTFTLDVININTC